MPTEQAPADDEEDVWGVTSGRWQTPVPVPQDLTATAVLRFASEVLEYAAAEADQAGDVGLAAAHRQRAENLADEPHDHLTR